MGFDGKLFANGLDGLAERRLNTRADIIDRGPRFRPRDGFVGPGHILDIDEVTRDGRLDERWKSPVDRTDQQRREEPRWLFEWPVDRIQTNGTDRHLSLLGKIGCIERGSRLGVGIHAIRPRQLILERRAIAQSVLRGRSGVDEGLDAGSLRCIQQIFRRDEVGFENARIITLRGIGAVRGKMEHPVRRERREKCIESARFEERNDVPRERIVDRSKPPRGVTTADEDVNVVTAFDEIVREKCADKAGGTRYQDFLHARSFAAASTDAVGSER